MKESKIVIELTDRQLKLVRANVAYAIENCPVDGGIMTEDGHFSTKKFYETLERRMKALPIQASNVITVDQDELNFIIATAEYALENCPVEGKIMMEDAQFSSTEMFKALIKRLKNYRRIPLVVPQITPKKRAGIYMRSHSEGI